ncbi:MAG: hypothetical protein RIC55_02335 [Pirellulaceae bacterium]
MHLLAWKRGVCAACSGGSEIDNPYPRHSDLWTVWRDGFRYVALSPLVLGTVRASAKS